jgi:hypothetical protein
MKTTVEEICRFCQFFIQFRWVFIRNVFFSLFCPYEINYCMFIMNFRYVYRCHFLFFGLNKVRVTLIVQTVVVVEVRLCEFPPPSFWQQFYVLLQTLCNNSWMREEKSLKFINKFRKDKKAANTFYEFTNILRISCDHTDRARTGPTKKNQQQPCERNL